MTVKTYAEQIGKSTRTVQRAIEEFNKLNSSKLSKSANAEIESEFLEVFLSEKFGELVTIEQDAIEKYTKAVHSIVKKKSDQLATKSFKEFPVGGLVPESIHTKILNGGKPTPISDEVLKVLGRKFDELNPVVNFIESENEDWGQAKYLEKIDYPHSIYGESERVMHVDLVQRKSIKINEQQDHIDSLRDSVEGHQMQNTEIQRELLKLEHEADQREKNLSDSQEYAKELSAENEQLIKASAKSKFTKSKLLQILPLPMYGLAASYGVYYFAALEVPNFVAIAEAAAFELTFIGLATIQNLSENQKKQASLVSIAAVAVSLIYNALTYAHLMDKEIFDNLSTFFFWALAFIHGAPLPVLGYFVANLIFHQNDKG